MNDDTRDNQAAPPDDVDDAPALSVDRQQFDAADEQPTRVSLMTGDRICIHCTYNLIGQPILREPHYNLLIVRCPECGMVTPTQEYPLLGKWAGRLGTLLAGFWMLLIIVLLVLTSLMLFGLATGTTEMALEDYRMYLNNVFNEVRTQNTSTTISFDTWYATQDKQQLLADAGGPLGGLSPYLLLPLLATVILVPIVGAFWSVVLIGMRFGKLMLFALIVWLIALAFSSITIADTLAMSPTWTSRAAWQQLGVYLLPTFITISAPLQLIGMALGRPFMRWLSKVMLPPRMWCRMSWLWTACDLDPPRPPADR